MDVVTGATGLIGNVLVRKLLEQGRDVGVFLRKTSETKCFDSLSGRIEKFYGDLLDPESLSESFKSAENVYHVASEISILSGHNPNLINVNLTGTKNVIKACRINKVKKLVYTSSIHIFKELQNNSCDLLDEGCKIDPFNPLGEYNRTKAAATLEVLNAASNGLNTVVVCPTAVIGPYDYRHSHLGSLIINYCRGRQKFIIDGAYDFVDVRDVAEGHILAAKNGGNGKLYILSGNRVTIPCLMKKIGELSGLNKPVYRIPFWVIFPVSAAAPVYYKLIKRKPVFTTYSIRTVRSNSYFSCKKASSELGYIPRPIEATLKDTLEWFTKQGYLK